MYHRLCLNICERSLYRASSGIRFQFNRLNHVANTNEKQRKMETISKFPDYKIIYRFPYIKYVSAVNAVKQQFTIFFGVSIPVIICFQWTNVMSPTIAFGSILTGFVFTLWLHSVGIFCNNFVGHVYLKQDGSKIILSYVNYWGKRMDMESSLNDIIPISDNLLRITDSIFKRIMFSSGKKTLKINLKFGQITDDNFKYILGTT